METTRPSIVVVGSLNVDHTLRVPRIPAPGETLTSSSMLTCFGGKGANQAVAAARAGGGATLFRGGDKSAGVFHPLAPAVLQLHQRIKRELDPASIFNPGRMYPDF